MPSGGKPCFWRGQCHRRRVWTVSRSIHGSSRTREGTRYRIALALHNFGMPYPEGYQKAQRLIRLADHFRLPAFTLIDIAGAYPDIKTEVQGQAQVVAEALRLTAPDLFRLGVVNQIVPEPSGEVHRNPAKTIYQCGAG